MNKEIDPAAVPSEPSTILTREGFASQLHRAVRRRSFLKGLGMAAATVPAGLLVLNPAGAKAKSTRLTKGDVAILQLLLAVELIESDLWQQYNELGGIGATGSISQPYITDLQILDGDMPQYIADNTDDEFSHAAFLTAYLTSKGQQPINLDQFRKLSPSKVSSVPQTGRLTNLMQLSVDTSWWVRYRSTTNPDLGATFPQAVQGLNVGQHPAIPTSNTDLSSGDHLKAIAFTAGFHFGFIEQGGTSLYATLSQKVTSLEVLKITISIGGAEIMHFQVWHDKAGNATPLTDGGITFVDLTQNQPETLQANLIMPEPCDFISTGLPQCSIIRPTSPGQLDATGVINAFITDGLFIGQPKEFTQMLLQLAADADAAERELRED